MKNDIALKILVRTFLFTLLAIFVFVLIVDDLYNDKIANMISGFDRSLYSFLVGHKTIFMAIFYILIFSIISFLVTSNMSRKMLGIMLAVDKILKEPNQEIKLSSDLISLEDKLNQIRLDVIHNQNVAKEAEAKKNDLIMYMAHDLKTPLTSVIGYLTLVNEEKEISQKLREKYIQIALDKALRVEDLTNQFFEITRYHLHDLPIHKTKLDLVMLIEQLVDECYPMLQERKLECCLTLPKQIQYWGDGDKIARAFENLLKNAIHYSYENTVIEIEMWEEKEKIGIIFKNKGDKIPEYKLDKLFEKFYRADEARQSNTGGTGLGLAIAKQIINLHNGEISVKNDTEWIEFHIKFRT